ncbi:MAG: cation:proton antiporter [Desulfarculus sp.]|nr:cation:proton antiporter [Desulfarculus sp.]
MLPPLLTDIVILFALGMAVVYLCQRLKVPSIVGFLLTGILAGPHGLAIIAHAHEVEVLAEIGVVLLLFTIGLEFSFGELMRIKRPMLLGGSLQVFLVVAGVAGLSLALGRDWGPSVFLGCVLSLSSTAIVLKLYQEGAAIDSPQGRTSLAILIYQDIIVVAMLLATPLLGGAVGPETGGGWQAMAKGGAVILALGLTARWGAPWLLRQVADTRSRELFIVTIVVMCLAVAWLTSWAGLSLALGAFLAGLIISDSPYSHQAIGNILPLRDLFTSLFFVSIGMLLDLHFLVANPLVVVLGLVGVLTLKSLTAGLATRALHLPRRVAIATGLSLAQVGEFSFILAQSGVPFGLLDPWTYQLVLVVSVLTMGLTPPLMALGQRMAAPPAPVLGSGRGAAASPNDRNHALSGHVLVVGYGLGGRNVARAARLTGLDYLILEMNPFTVRDEQAKGEPIVFGDAVNPAVLEHAGAASARAMVVTVPDPVATRRIVANAKALNPGLAVIARTRYQAELPALKSLGADEVVSEEFESAVEIFARLLKHLLLPETEVERLTAALRAGDYEQLRLDQPSQPAAICDLRQMLPELEIVTLRLESGAPAAGRSLAELELRQRHGVSVLAIRRDESIEGNPPAQARLRPGDWVVVMARPENLAAARGLFRAPGGPVFDPPAPA